MKFRPLALAACVLVTGLLAPVAHAEGRGVRTPEAVKIFNEVCGKTYPSFRNAEDRTLALGQTFEEENPAKDLWISAFTNTSSGRSGCSVRYGTVETVAKLIRNLGLLGTVTPTGPLTASVQFRNTSHQIEIRVNEARTNGRIIVQLDLELD